MNELANTSTQEVAVLDGLALQARALRMTINMNMWELARVFLEAKELLPHGEFGKWVQENADVSERTAQDMMAAYKRFGGKPQFQGLGQAKTFKLLPLPAGTEDKFLEEHDLQAMTAREVQEAVKQARAEAQAEIDRERQARMDAEQRALDAENRPAQIPPELTEELAASRQKVAETQAEMQRLAQLGNESLAEQRRLMAENTRLQRENQEQAEMLEEQQADIARAQEELLGMKSAVAKGDAERVPADQLTPDAFASAVRAFIGTVARMPHMRMTFAAMEYSQKREYSELLETVEKWAEDSRKALEATIIDGTVIYSE